MSVFEKQTADAYSQTRAQLVTHASANTPFDFMLLDIQFGDLDYGGIDIYNKLIDDGLRPYWRHTLVCSQYKDLLGPEGTVVEFFLKTAFIPFANYIAKHFRRDAELLHRIDEIVSGGVKPLIVGVSAGQPI